MDVEIYKRLLGSLQMSARAFDGVSPSTANSLGEDFDEIVASIDISKWSSNIDGAITSFEDLLAQLAAANQQKNRQAAIESIAMIRAAIMDIGSAFSNAGDSLENLVVEIRDA